MAIDNLTINYSIPVPSFNNDVAYDFPRLCTALDVIDEILFSKADSSDTYTKSEVESIAATILTATSTSNVAIGTGSKTFATQANKQFSVGQWLVISSSANPANFMFGQVTSYSTTTLVVNVVVVSGSGTLASWNISISGIQGLQGVTGATGATGAAGAQGIQGIQGIQGVAGANGATWLSGSGVPAAGTGANNDYYFRTDTSDIYKKAAGAWGSPIANIKGATGATGATGSQGIAGTNGINGATWLSGTSPAGGADGDYYFKTDTCDIYKKVAGSWGSPIVNIKGATGATGATGSQGVAGANGAAWYSGASAPTVGTGVLGDYYFRTDTSDIYKKLSGTWSIIANIKGATGATGSQGVAGADGSRWYYGASPTGGVDGDFFLHTETGDIYTKNLDLWGSPIANIKGATGVTGSQGIKGDTGDTGAQGIQGLAGLDGSTWLSGTSPTGGVDGDYYLKTDTCDIYKKVAGSWGSPIVNIKGESGSGGGADLQTIHSNIFGVY